MPEWAGDLVHARFGQASSSEGALPLMHVNVDNFRAAETARMFDNQLAMAGGVSAWFHYRAPMPIDAQPVIRTNRDTLYSGAVLDISQGATVTLPDAGGRYMTMMVINQEHYINRVFSQPGSYELTVDEHATAYVNTVVRTFVDPNDPEDIAAVNALQDGIVLETGSTQPYTHPDYDEASLTATRDALLELGEGIPDTDRTFGKESEVEPTRHLIGTALGWGGLPDSEAYYYIEAEPRPAGRYTFTFKDVPVDAFWSVTIYNRDGYFERNPYDAYNRNSVTAHADDDGTVTLDLGPDGEGLDNYLYVMDGWNCALRLYKPHQSVLDKTWTPPTPQPA